MRKRSYNQYCAVARGLDVVGERWTLLVVRELLTGPKRFKDLLDGLPGIGTNLLAKRLRDLEGHGIVWRTTLPPPAGSAVYELTDRGRSLESVTMALSQWGMELLGAPREEDYFRPGWLVLAMKSSFRPEEASGLRETYEFRIEGEVFHVRVDDGRCEARQGPASDPDLVVSADTETFLAVATGRIEPADATEAGALRVEGDRETLVRCARIFGLTETDRV
jgi:DNA-binding HxlR family transcriptional regulator/putative sterol carrier protein